MIKIQTLNNIAEWWNNATTFWEIMPPPPKNISNEHNILTFQNFKLLKYTNKQIWRKN